MIDPFRHLLAPPTLLANLPFTPPPWKGHGAYQEVVECDGEVRVDNQLLGFDRGRFLDLGRDEHADGSDQLKLGPFDLRRREDPVEVVDGQRKDLLFTTLLLAHLK